MVLKIDRITPMGFKMQIRCPRLIKIAYIGNKKAPALNQTNDKESCFPCKKLTAGKKQDAININKKKHLPNQCSTCKRSGNSGGLSSPEMADDSMTVIRMINDHMATITNNRMPKIIF